MFLTADHALPGLFAAGLHHLMGHIIFSQTKRKPSLTPDVKHITFRKTAAEELLRMAERERAAWDERICLAYGLPLPEIRVRHMISRWGVCHIRTGQIVLSTRLIHYPPQGFSYVLLHEYVHFLVPDHSRNFYAIVAKHMPDYKEKMRVLKQVS